MGFRFPRQRFADRHFKDPAEMARLFHRYPEAVARTVEIAANRGRGRRYYESHGD